MTQVRVEPSGVAFDVETGETIIQAAWRNNVTWPTICNGQGTCKVCVCMVIEGAEHCSAIAPFEAEGLASVADSLAPEDATWRLACQATTSGDVRLRKVGVRPA